MNPQNKRLNVLITGGSGDIGCAVAERFHKGSYNVAIHYSGSFERAEALRRSLLEKRSDLLVNIYHADFRDPEAASEMTEKVISEMGPLDVLVNNAGLGRQKLITVTSYKEWRETFAVNSDAAFLCAKAALPCMINAKKGKIVNVSSVWGITGASCEVDYSAAKAALIGFTKALAKEVGPSGINVNCVAPGVVDTRMNSHLSKQDLDALCDETPLGRLGTPEEIAELVYYLASEEASFITGQVISPNGGFVI